MSDAITIELAGTEVRLSHPGKVFFAERGETKLDLIRYYEAVAEPLLAVTAQRPVMLERYPDGAGGKSWFQKRVPSGAPEWLRTTRVTTLNGTTGDALVAADIAHIAWAVNLGCLGFHVWPFRAGAPQVADELRIDLDPSPGVGFAQVAEAALATRELLVEMGIAPLVKTSGSRGLHVYVPLESRWDGYAVRAAAVALARALERAHPELITAAWWKEQRGARVFVDFNQNAPHKTMFGAWCARPRPGGQVSTPIGWDEVPTVEPDTLTLASVPARLAERGDPWAGARPQTIEPLLELAERDRAAGWPDAPWPAQYPKQPSEPPRVAPSRARRAEPG